MKPNEIISQKRIAMNISEAEFSKSTNITLERLYDIEAYEDEIFNLTDIGDIKKICKALDINIMDLFNISCPFCSNTIRYSEEFTLPLGKLISLRRQQLKMITEELGNCVGYHSLAIVEIENNSEYLESANYDLISGLAMALNLPLQLILGAKCENCGR